MWEKEDTMEGLSWNPAVEVAASNSRILLLREKTFTSSPS
jgi:hypothetical protein